MESVKITIEAKQKEPGGKPTVLKQELQGEYACKNGKHYLRYVDSQLVEQGQVHTTVKFSPEDLLILRRGAMNWEQRFVPGSETRSAYHTPYGKMELCMDTRELRVRCQDGSGKIRLRYCLRANDMVAGEYDLKITFLQTAYTTE